MTSEKDIFDPIELQDSKHFKKRPKLVPLRVDHKVHLIEVCREAIPAFVNQDWHTGEEIDPEGCHHVLFGDFSDSFLVHFII